MFIKPVDGALVRDPITTLHLPEQGAEVPESAYWLRRIADGSVTLEAGGKIDVAAKKLAEKNKQING